MVPRACEGCRIRKIRCDRSIPCSNCRTSEITCQSAHISSNSHPKPDRVTQLTEALLPDKFIISILKSFKVRTPIFLTSEYDLKSQLARCEYNVNSGLESYDVLAVPAFENVLALTMGIIKAQEEAKLLLCSTLICAAAGHCRMLGYHRETTYQNDRTGRAESMRRLFWTVYVFDKNISLLSGQSSCLRDSDIDASYPSPLVKPDLRPWDESFILGIKLAQLQGQIYDNLYSVSALRSALDDRKQSVGGLVPAMRQLRIELENIDGKHAANPQIFELSRKHWDVMYYSTLTSLLRASSIPGPGAEINSQCFEAARLSLQSHIQCFSGYHSTGFLTDADYSNWVLHFSSFTPFIVIFLHAIAGTCAEDVQLLDDLSDICTACERSGSIAVFRYRDV
ncbi:hypothetical protein VTK73DRAFT_1553 [Phialemonium thermophilum]|uniref:Zn(2)-C6 fungal-type domain-containing protein n=1 Tax=Phialemonium thermophilum TaxID=223376 RepID=A0ABR3X9H0_9PEZI